jgi:hypothetical protein
MLWARFLGSIGAAAFIPGHCYRCNGIQAFRQPALTFYAACCMANHLETIQLSLADNEWVICTRRSTLVAFESSVVNHAVEVPFVDPIGSFSATFHSLRVSWTRL